MTIYHQMQTITDQAEVLAEKRFESLDLAMLTELNIKAIAKAAYIDGLRESMELLLTLIEEKESLSA